MKCIQGINDIFQQVIDIVITPVQERGASKVLEKKRITPCKEGDWGYFAAYPGLLSQSQSSGVFQSQKPCESALVNKETMYWDTSQDR